MKKYIAAALSVILLSIILQYAYGDWIDYINWKVPQTDVLQVCIYEAQEDELSEYKDYYLAPTLLALGEWEERLKTYTGGDNYDLNVSYIPKEKHEGKTQWDFDYCQIHITYWVEENLDVPSTALGGTYNHIESGLSFVEIYPIDVLNIAIVENGRDYTSEELEELTTEKRVLIPQQGIYSVVLHEFGHSLGLGHLCNELFGHRFDSAMKGAFDPYNMTLELTDYDLAAVYHLYGEDGWGGEDNGYRPYMYGNISKEFRGHARCT